MGSVANKWITIQDSYGIKLILSIELKINVMGCFKAGDVVELKSGSPKMTVKMCDPNAAPGREKRVFCQWFDNVDLKEKWFPESLLKLFEEN